ncbi:MAG TPA: type II secretion system F family protein [Candidatus Binataceae bacterium]|nr:type II secretion system F family protein [Candidatus Binataceae bacterium]
MDQKVALLLVGMMAVVALLVARRRRRPGMTRALLLRMMRPEPPKGVDITRAGRRQQKSSELFRAFYRLNLLHQLEVNMWQAGIYAPVADVLLIMVLLCGAGVIGGDAIWNDLPLSLALGAGLASLPIVYIRIRRQRRLKEFANQLPYVLDLIKSSLEAGHTLLRAFQVIVAEFSDPVAGEFRSVIEQSRLGLPLPRALEQMLDRVPIDDLRLLIVAVQVQSEVGSSLAHIVGRLSEIVRTRQRLHQQIRALTAQSRMSGLVVGLLPVVLLAAFSVIQPAYTHALFYDPQGLLLLKIAGTLDLIAFFMIRKLVNVAY